MELSMSLPAGTVEVSEALVDQAVEACGGDLRDTVRALLVGQVQMGGQVLKMRGKISVGYIRRITLATMDAVNGK
ncbi:MAG: hypothetical protein K0S56_4461 [Microvirga sp.]|jgi:Mor family transcriptional regulator|nr:hypothetical protein [Microvirga sp.]